MFANEKTASPSCRSWRKRRPRLERLEGRAVPAVLEIVNPGGVGTTAVGDFPAERAAVSSLGAGEVSLPPSVPADHRGWVGYLNTVGPGPYAHAGTSLRYFQDAAVTEGFSLDLHAEYKGNVPEGAPETLCQAEIGTSPSGSPDVIGSWVTVAVRAEPGEAPGQPIGIRIITQEVGFGVESILDYGTGFVSYEVQYRDQGQPVTVLSGIDRGWEHRTVPAETTFRTAVGRTFQFSMSLVAQGTVSYRGQTASHLSYGKGDLYARLAPVPDPTPNIRPTRLSWDGAHKGVEFAYAVSGSDLPRGTSVALFWARGPRWEDRLTGALAPATAQGSVAGSPHGPVRVRAERLGLPPKGTRYLLAVADPPATGYPRGLIDESSETDNVLALKASWGDILKVPKTFDVTVHGQLVQAEFRPAGGALTLKQAAALAWVDHFNWVQYVVQDPKGLTAKLARDVQVTPTGRVLAERDRSGRLVHVDPKTGRLTGRPVILDSARLPFLDPVVQRRGASGQDMRVLFDAKGSPFFVTVDSAPDRLPYFWDEPGELKAFRDDFVLRFGDAPLAPAEYYRGGGATQFRTYLAGVSSGARFQTYAGHKVSFTWKTNAKPVGGRVYDVSLF